jgi:WD40 repeat protein
MLGAQQLMRVAISPDQRIIALMYRTDEVRLWDGEVPGEFQNIEVTGLVTDIAFSSDSTILAVGSFADEDDGVKLFDANTGAALQTLSPIPFPVDIEFSFDSATVSVAEGGKISIWDVKDGSLLQELQIGEEFSIADISFSGNVVAVGDNVGTVSLWQLP